MEVQATKGIMEVLLREENLLTMVAVWSLIFAFQRAFPEIWNHSICRRTKHFIPLLFCSIAVWLPGVQPPEAEAGDLIILGIVLGFGVGHLHGLMKRLGWGPKDPPAAKPPGSA